MSGNGDCHNRNIEIKAKIADEIEFKRKLEIAKKLTGEDQATKIVQHDVFFNVPNGRLKLRYEENSKNARLVQYSRSDVAGPKLSKFNITEIPDGKLFQQMLEESVGVLGVLDKIRYLFLLDRTRIHLDIVNNKGIDYYGLEFEVVMKKDEDLELGNQIANDLLKAFEVEPTQLLEGSYFEILNTK